MAMSTTLFRAPSISLSADISSNRLQGRHFISSLQTSPGKFIHRQSPSPLTVIHDRNARDQALCSRRIPLPPPAALFAAQADASAPVEEQKALLAEIEAELAHFGNNIEPDSLLQALETVDLIERLGIQRYFPVQIRRVLHSAFLQWDEERGLSDSEATVAAFRLLRLHGYPVSAAVFENLRDEEKGFHAYFSTATQRQVLCMINLYKCSQLGFPSEMKIMAEVEDFTRTQLWKTLREGSETLLETNNLSIAIKFALEFPRRYLLPRLESRSVVRQLWPAADGNTRKYLELARLDLNMLQKLYQEEMQEIDRWWKQHRFHEVSCARRQNEKIYFSTAACMYEPELSALRLVYSKTGSLTLIVDDLFDDQRRNPQEFRRFTEALKRWDPSLLDDLPHHKIVLAGLCSTAEEIAAVASKIQNQDLLPLYKELWIRFVSHYAMETEWMHSQHIPSFEEYLEVGHFSIAAAIITWSSVFVMGELITNEISNLIGPGSRCMYLNGLISRVSNDLVGYEKESREGKVATIVNCYMRDHPGSSEQEAVASIQGLIESSCHELEWEIYRSMAKVPERCIRSVVGYARCACLIYKQGEGFSGNVSDFIEVFEDYLFHSLE